MFHATMFHGVCRIYKTAIIAEHTNGREKHGSYNGL